MGFKRSAIEAFGRELSIGMLTRATLHVLMLDHVSKVTHDYGKRPGDPFDCLILAQVPYAGLPILSPDRYFAPYPTVPVMS